MTMRRREGLVALAWACAAVPIGARAHHGFGGRYDITRPIWLDGRVESVRIGMPHPLVRLRVATTRVRPDTMPQGEAFEARLVLRPEDAGQLREVEFPPVARFLDLGPEIKRGDTVAVIALRNCSAPHQLRGQWIRLASGRLVVRSGRMQTEVEGCDRG